MRPVGADRMSDNEPFAEIRGALCQLRRAFEKHHMTPAILELADARQSRHLLAMIDPQHMPIVNGMDAKGNPMRQVEIEGVIVRWPARVISMGIDSFDYTDY